MVSITRTLTVDSSRFNDDLPDDSGDTIDIDVVAFDDSLYIKVPRSDRAGTSDHCMDYMSIFRAITHIVDRGELAFDSTRKEMGVLRKQTTDYTILDDESDVTIRKRPDHSVHPAHEQAVSVVEEVVGDIQSDPYWNGYREGVCNEGGDWSWVNLAWKSFEKNWEGNRELLADIGEWFVEEGIAVCQRSQALFPIPEWSAPTGSYVNTISAVHHGTCPYCGADKTDHWECIESPSSTRRPNVYECQSCGNTKRGITTG